MEIYYRKRKHEQLVLNVKKLKQVYGERNSQEILLCIHELNVADSLRAIPPCIRPHPLTSNILIYSVDVEHPNRLLFMPYGQYDSEDPLSTVASLEIVELSINTHDKKFNSHNY